MTLKKVLWCCGLLVLAACCGCYGGGASSTFYTLQAAQERPEPLEIGKDSQWIIGMGPVTLPEYLDRTAVVSRISPNRLEVNDNHYWAGSLRSEITRVLAGNLEGLPHVKEVAVFPWSNHIEPDLRFRVEIQTFDGRPGGIVLLKAVWSLSPAQSERPAVRRVSRIEEPVKGLDIEDLVAAMGRALSVLSVEMADAVGKVAVQ